MDRIQENDTIAALRILRDKCASDLKRLEQTMQGLETKIGHTRAKLEMAEEMIETAQQTQKKPNPMPA